MNDKERVEFSVKGQLDLSDVELETDVPLRVAAVRDGEILASQELSPKKKLPYELSFRYPWPCGFRLVVGRAEIPDSVFLATGSPRSGCRRSRRRRAGPEARVRARPDRDRGDAVQALAPLVPARYRVRGRVVCRNWHWNGFHFVLCDDPVPGATVEIRDTDCLWWFCRSA